MRRLLILLSLAVPLIAQNTVLAPAVHIPLQDQNGRPLNGGRVYTCTAGTSCPGNPLPTFQDAGGTIENANPTILDFTGYAPIRYSCGENYKVVAQNSAGVTQWTVDNVSGSCSLNDITGVSGDFLVPGRLTTGRGPLIDVTAPQYGAVHDDLTDDTVHINAAIIYAGTKGGTVYFPCGTYLLSAVPGLVVSTPNVSWKGEQQQCVVFHYTGAGSMLTVQMNPFVSEPAGTFSDFTVIGTPAGANGILSGQIVAGQFENIGIGGFSGAGSAGLHLHNKGSFITWTERNLFKNITLGGVLGGRINTNDVLLSSDNPADSFGYNNFLDIKMNSSTGGTCFNLASGFFYNSTIRATCNMDNADAGSVGPIAFKSSSNWDNNFVELFGEFQNAGSGTGTPYRLQVDAASRFVNLYGSHLNVLAPGGAQAADNIVPAAVDSPNVSMVAGGQITSWDTGSFALNGIATKPQPIQRGNAGSIGMLFGANLEVPYLSMGQATGAAIPFLTVPSGQPIANGVIVGSMGFAGDFHMGSWIGQCNSFLSGCTAPGSIDGTVHQELSGFTSAHRSGFSNSYYVTTNGINESTSGDPNFSGGMGFVEGANIAHPIVWAYNLDPIDFGVYEKTFQTPLASGNLVFQITKGGGLGQGAATQNIAGSCSLSTSASCSWSPTNSRANAMKCVGSPEFIPSAFYSVTGNLTSCTVTFSGAQTGTFTFIAVGNPN